jgi:hypothetical protein
MAGPLWHGALDMISQRLGLDPGTLDSALAKGACVDELAARQGISSSDLQGEVVAHLEQARAVAGQAPIEPDALAGTVSRAFAQGRRSVPVAAEAPVAGRDPIAVYGAAGRVMQEPAVAGISILA